MRGRFPPAAAVNRRALYLLAGLALLAWLFRDRLRSGTTMAIEKGAQLLDPIRRQIEREEGRRNYAYLDSAGKWTIGIGHLILPTEQYLLKYTKDNPAPDELINKLFDGDVAGAKGTVDTLGVPLTDNQRAALVSLVFNIGPGAFYSSTLRKKLLARDMQGAAEEILRWKNSGGQPVLLARRERERELFLAA